MIRIENVQKVYSRRRETVTAFACENLEISSGEYISVVGPSGSGKSTMLSLLGGMLSPTSGRIYVDDVSLYDQPVRIRTGIRRDVMAFIFQTFNLIPYLSALENVQVPLGIARLPADQQRRRAGEMLERFGLASRLDHRPTELSIGQQQRVALARALVSNPKIIYADEPTGNLDPASRESVLTAFDEFHRTGGIIVMVTHDPVAAQSAKRIYRLTDGRLAEGQMERRCA